MPRRKGDEAKTKALSKAAAHIHFIARNNEFLRDLENLREHFAKRQDSFTPALTCEMVEASRREEEIAEAKRLHRQ